MMYQRLRDLREDHDKTQKDIASVLNISQTTYSRYEAERSTFPAPRSFVLHGFIMSVPIICSD